MKYILLFVSSQEENEAAAARLAKLTEAERFKASEPYMKWF